MAGTGRAFYRLEAGQRVLPEKTYLLQGFYPVFAKLSL
jgi:hypothetical protein